jgi:Glycoside hydrolase 123, N-terminal domain
MPSICKNLGKAIVTLAAMSSILSCSPAEQYDVSYLAPNEKQVVNTINGIEYTSGNWQEITYQYAETSLGNHRAIIKTPAGKETVKVHLPWRRRDINLQDKKRVIIINPETADTVNNMVVKEYNAEYGELIFATDGKTAAYHAYYYPFHTTGSYYPVVNYLAAKNTADENWIAKYEAISNEDYAQLPQAEVVAIQSINDFNSFFPMEIAAKQTEVDSFITANPQDYYLFPEYRDNPIKMTKKIPHHWLTRGVKNGLRDDVKRGEYYAFQIGVYAAKLSLSNISLTYTDLHSGSNTLSADQFECININGVNLGGKPFTKRIDVEQGKIQSMWIGLTVPEDSKPGEYKGMVIFTPEGVKADTIHLSLNIVDEIIKDYGDDEPKNMSRLRWLNSTLGSEDDFIISPFIPVIYQEKTLKILGREIDLDKNGLPSQIRSYFTESVTGLKDVPEQILAAPITFNIVEAGKAIAWQSEPFEIKNQSKGRAVWTTNSTSSDFDIQVKGVLEYDGMLNYQIAVIAKKDIAVENIKLRVPYSTSAAKYILGLGYKGSTRPNKVDWHWDVTKHHEGVWLGNVNRGLQFVLRDKNYQRPLNTNFYQSQPLNLPPSWYNEGKGGIKIAGNSKTVLAENYSGPRKINKGDTLNFHIRFLITPFKTINTNTHFNTRFVHKYTPVDSVKIYGGTVVNVHHANEINPYINYPFYHLNQQKKYIDEAHAKGVKVKLYNTIRELSYKAYELFPMRSLGFEIFNDGDGGGHPWLQEHLEADYHKAWHAWRVNDAAILDKGTSRWTNYYIEGLNWLAKNQEIDGLYLDDIAFTRETVKRMVTVLSRQRGEAIIDLHSANQYNDRDGYINSAFLYMEHFPYISRLWFGEYFEYGLDPDYWLTEVSGIPFGLTGEMLQGGGHPYRGMVYGMTTRVYGKYNPQPIWELFDDFGIADSEMIGYWVEDVPVKTNNKLVPVSVYKKEGTVLLALGSWSDKDEIIDLAIDWQQLGIDNPETTTWRVPAVEGLQKGRILPAGKPFVVEKGQGLFMIIRDK